MPPSVSGAFTLKAIPSFRHGLHYIHPHVNNTSLDLLVLIFTRVLFPFSWLYFI